MTICIYGIIYLLISYLRKWRSLNKINLRSTNDNRIFMSKLKSNLKIVELPLRIYVL